MPRSHSGLGQQNLDAARGGDYLPCSIVFPLLQLRRSTAAALFLFWSALSICETHAPAVLCSNGEGNFDAEFRTGIKVHIGAARDGGLATRACSARLEWETQELV